ncbi:Hypothetical protein CINCED_3A005924 [Cinara cedri]|uniref:Uncharacterized protein n=1 Tax=Cinara cedri TaxID=506608 RepID=A0A5E4M6E6_9HEMI|nr:Hypothetical protein CINCED_3A005924 [Cinara cedri]
MRNYYDETPCEASETLRLGKKWIKRNGRERRHNKEMLDFVNEKRFSLSDLASRRWCINRGHTLRHNKELHSMLECTVEG